MDYHTAFVADFHIICIVSCSIHHKCSLVSLILMNYYEVTREYKASCTVGKAANMMSFEEVLKQYEPMIFAAIRKLNIYRDYEEYKQAGRVALWHAWQRFDEDKGNFTAFAYRSIQGAILDELKIESRFGEYHLQMEDDLVDTVMDSSSFIGCEWSGSLAEALDLLSLAELELIQSLFIEGISLAECAVRNRITVAGIKKRRERTLVKLRHLLS